MKDRELREALTKGGLIYSRAYPDIGMDCDAQSRQWDKEKIANIDARLNALFRHLGLEYVEYSEPFVRKIKANHDHTAN